MKINNQFKRTCRNPSCGNILTLSRQDDGRIVQCPKCEYYQKVIGTRLCDTVSNIEINDLISGEYDQELYRIS